MKNLREFLAAVAAELVYQRFGKKRPGTDVIPKAGGSNYVKPGYYMYAGYHGTVPSASIY